MAPQVFRVKFKEDFEVEDLYDLLTIFSEWDDASSEDIQEFGSSFAYDCSRYQVWKQQLKCFLQFAPLVYTAEGTTDWKPLFELPARAEAYLNDDYLFEAIGNYMDGSATDPSKDAIRMDRNADGLLHSAIGLRLLGNKSLLWRHCSPCERQESRLATGMKNLREMVQR